MHDNKSDVKQYNTSGYNSSRLSFTIVGVNIVSVLMKINNGSITSTDILSINNILLITSLFLAGLDLLLTYKKDSMNRLLTGMRFFAIVSSLLSGFILLLKLMVILEFCTIVNQTDIAFAGNLANIYTYLNLKYFELNNCVFCYLIASLLQAVASILKVFVDRQIKTNIREQG